MRLDQGGHLTHGSPASITSKFWNFVSYGVTPRSDDPASPGEQIDFDNVRDLALQHRPKMIVAGATAYARLIEPAPFREIADEVGALLMFDSAHVAGLIAGGSHPNPVPYADVVSFTTHKTLRGPRGGAIICREEYAKKIDSAVFPGSTGWATRARRSPPRPSPSKRRRCRASRSTPSRSSPNAQAFGEALANEGFRLVSGGTDNHMVLVDLRDFDAELTGKVAQEVLGSRRHHDEPQHHPRRPAQPVHHLGASLGTAAETTAGHEGGRVRDDRHVDGARASPPRRRGDLAEVRADVAELCARVQPLRQLHEVVHGQHSAAYIAVRWWGRS